MIKTTNNWPDFLPQPAVTFDDMTTANFISPLSDLGLIALHGEEAVSFLHNQITNDVAHLDHAQARLAGYCSPKGRLLATFLMWRSGDNILLQLPRSLQATIQKRLQMFVLRSQVKLIDVSDSHVMFGLVGHAVATTLVPWFTAVPTVPYAKIDNNNGSLIRVSDANGIPRYQWITTADVAIAAWPTLIQSLQPVASCAWRLTDIQAGIAHITLPTQEQFVPQMINFEVVGGVNFKKGCYPGQEIVARSQYLGKIKRRAVIATIDAIDVAAATDVFSSTDPGQPCGMIINAERSAPNTSTCLLEIKLAALENGTIHLGTINGPQLYFQPLPYVLSDITTTTKPT